MPARTPTLPVDFRRTEAAQILRWVAAGESVSIVGVSGIGKSNLFNHLLDARLQHAHLSGDGLANVLVRVNCHTLPDFTERSVYSLMLEQLEWANGTGLSAAIQRGVRQHHEQLLAAGADALRAQRYFKLALRTVMGRGRAQRRLIFLFDQFDDLYRQAASQVFSILRGLREEYKYRLAFCLFARDTLPRLLTPADTGRDEFYELVASHVLYLKPYPFAEAAELLRRLATRHHRPLPAALTEALFTQVGGHAGLLRAAYLALQPEALPDPAEWPHLPGVQMECARLWNSLSVEEQAALAKTARRLPLPRALGLAMRDLQNKGLLSDAEPPQIFSPLWAAYIAEQEAPFEKLVHLDHERRQVFIEGQLIRKPLSVQEYRLFEVLYQQPDAVVSHATLIEAAWPDEAKRVEHAELLPGLVAAMARLKDKIEPDRQHPRYLESVRGFGYRLNTEKPADAA